jgi:hypothetical protein
MDGKELVADGQNDGLSARQMHALEALLAGKSKREAAAEVGVHPKTISRWLKQPPFAIALNREVREALRLNSLRTARTLGLALELLGRIIESDLHPRLKLQAAAVILQHHPEVTYGPLDEQGWERQALLDQLAGSLLDPLSAPEQEQRQLGLFAND